MALNESYEEYLHQVLDDASPSDSADESNHPLLLSPFSPILKTRRNDESIQLSLHASNRPVMPVIMVHPPSSLALQASQPCVFPIEDTSSAQQELVIVNPKALGQELPSVLTMETARLVAASSEDWARSFRFGQILWPPSKQQQPEQTSTVTGLMNICRAAVHDVTRPGSIATRTLLCMGEKNVFGKVSRESVASVLSAVPDESMDVATIYKKFGVLGCCVHELLQTGFTVTLGLVHVGPEHLHDLLQTRPFATKLVLESKRSIRGLSQNAVDSLKGLGHLVRRGLKSHSKRPTAHVLAYLHVWHKPNQCTKIIVGDVWSPAPSLTEAPTVKERRRRAALSSSVTVLGTVLRNSLLRHAGNEVVLSFRESLLTRVLRDAIEREDVRTVVLGGISPLGDDYAATLQTLRYASRLSYNPMNTAVSPFGRASKETLPTTASSVDSNSKAPVGRAVLNNIGSPQYLQHLISDPRQRLATIGGAPKEALEPLSDALEDAYKPTSYLGDDNASEPSSEHPHIEAWPSGDSWNDQFLNKSILPTPVAGNVRRRQERIVDARPRSPIGPFGDMDDSFTLDSMERGGALGQSSPASPLTVDTGEIVSVRDTNAVLDSAQQAESSSAGVAKRLLPRRGQSHPNSRSSSVHQSSRSTSIHQKVFDDMPRSQLTDSDGSSSAETPPWQEAADDITDHTTLQLSPPPAHLLSEMPTDSNVVAPTASRTVVPDVVIQASQGAAKMYQESLNAERLAHQAREQELAKELHRAQERLNNSEIVRELGDGEIEAQRTQLLDVLEERDTARVNLAKLERSYEAKDRELKYQRNQALETERKLRMAENAAETASRDAEEISRTESVLEQKLREARQEITMLKEKSENLERQGRTLQEIEQSSLRARIEGLVNERDGLKEQLDGATVALNDQKMRLEDSAFVEEQYAALKGAMKGRDQDLQEVDIAETKDPMLLKLHESRIEDLMEERDQLLSKIREKDMESSKQQDTLKALQLEVEAAAVDRDDALSSLQRQEISQAEEFTLLREQYENIKNKLKEKDSLLEQLEAKRIEDSRHLQKSQSRVEELTEEVQDVTSQLQSVEDMMEEQSVAEHDILKRVCAERDEARRSLQRYLDEKATETNEGNEEIGRYKSIVLELEQQHVHLKKERDEVVKITEEAIATQAELESKVTSLEELLAKSSAKSSAKKDLEAQMESMRSELDEYKTQLGGRNAAVAELTKTLMSLEAEREQLVSERDESAMQVRELVPRLKQYETESGAGNNELRRQLDDAIQKFEGSSVELNQMRSLLGAKNTVMEGLRAQVARMEARLKQSEVELVTKADETESLRQELSNANRELQTLLHNQKSSVAEENDLEQRLSVALSERDRLASRLQQLSIEGETRQTKLFRMERALDHFRSETKSRVEKVVRHRQEESRILEEALAENRSLEHRNHELTMALQNVRATGGGIPTREEATQPVETGRGTTNIPSASIRARTDEVAAYLALSSKMFSEKSRCGTNELQARILVMQEEKDAEIQALKTRVKFLELRD